jgi:hypothetical protein
LRHVGQVWFPAEESAENLAIVGEDLPCWVHLLFDAHAADTGVCTTIRPSTP